MSNERQAWWTKEGSAPKKNLDDRALAPSSRAIVWAREDGTEVLASFVGNVGGDRPIYADAEDRGVVVRFVRTATDKEADTGVLGAK